MVREQVEAALEDLPATRIMMSSEAVGSSLAEAFLPRQAEELQTREVIAVQEEQLAAKDAEVASVVAAKDKELQQLRAQLARLEGVPPQRD